jgi:hypothetical protein
MDSLFEYIIIIAIFWSFISSFISKKKKTDANAFTSNSDSSQEFNSELINDLTNLLKSSNVSRSVESTKVDLVAKPSIKRNAAFNKEFKGDIRKRESQNKRLKSIKIEETDSFLHHTQHVLDENEVQTETILVPAVIGNLNAQRIREAFILKEIIDKPVALRNR